VSYSLHPDAATDLTEAASFYRRKAGAALASRFLDEFERVARLLVEHPALGTPLRQGRRIFPLRFFPYSVVYRGTYEGLLILLVRHQRRAPRYFQK